MCSVSCICACLRAAQNLRRSDERCRCATGAPTIDDVVAAAAVAAPTAAFAAVGTAQHTPAVAAVPLRFEVQNECVAHRAPAPLLGLRQRIRVRELLHPAIGRISSVLVGRGDAPMPHGRGLPATSAVPIPSATLTAGAPEAPTGTSSTTFTAAATAAAATALAISATAVAVATPVSAASLATSAFTAAAIGSTRRTASISASIHAGLDVDHGGLLRRLPMHGSRRGRHIALQMANQLTCGQRHLRRRR